MLGDKLVALRKKNGHSQQELADKLQVTRQTISNWELGQGVPSLDKAMELLLESGLDWGYNSAVKVLEVNDEWMRIEYARTKENHLVKKETVIKLIDIDMIKGIEIVEEE